MNFILFPPIFLQNRIVLTTCCIRRMCTLEQKEVWLESAKWCGLWSSHLWNPPSSTIIPVPPICVSEMTPTLIQVLNSAPPWLLCLYMCINIQCLSSQQPLHQACVITSVKATGYSGQEHGSWAQAAWVQIPALLLTTCVTLAKNWASLCFHLVGIACVTRGSYEDGKT